MASNSLQLATIFIVFIVTLSYASQNFTRMWCYFHCLWNHFIDYCDNLIPNGAVIYTGDVPFQCKGQEGRYTEFLGS